MTEPLFGDDNVINNAESKDSQEIGGTVGKSVRDGDVVKVTIGGETYETTVANGTWSITVPADKVGELEAGKVTATVSGEDEYGNPYSANDDADFTVQTDLPEAEITITEPLFGDDNVINNAESKDSQEIGGTVGKSVRDGDVVKVTIGGETYETTVANGTWSITVPADKVGELEAGKVTATVSGEDEYGNPYSANDDADFTVQTDLPEAEITITEPLFGDDNVINNAESKDSQEIGGTVGKSVRDGDVVKVTIGGETYETTVANGTWSITVPADKVGELEAGKVTATVSGEDEYGNPYSANDDADFTVQTDLPEAEITITEPLFGDDNVINNAESKDSQEIGGTVGKSVRDGDVVKVTIGGETYETTVANGTWSITVPADKVGELEAGKVTATVSGEDEYGNPYSANDDADFTVQTDLPEAEITITEPLFGDDNVINNAESKDSQEIGGTVGKSVRDGDVVKVTIGGETYETTVANGTWSITVPADKVGELEAGKVTATVSGEDEYGNPYSANDDADFTVQTDLPEAEITITEPLFGDDNVINNAESKDSQEIGGTVGKSVRDGDVVKVTIGGETYETTVANGTWSITVPADKVGELEAGKVTATVSGEDEYGNPYSANDDADFTVQTDLPEAEITITEPLFGDDNVINNAESKDSQEIGGTVGKSVRDGDVVKVTIGGETYETTVANGTWSITVPADKVGELEAGKVTATVSGEDEYGNPYSANDDADFTVQTDLPEAEITITEPLFGDDNVINNAESKDSQEIGGTVGKSVRDGDVSRSPLVARPTETTVANGTWSITVPADKVGELEAGKVTATVSGEDEYGNPYSANDDADFTVQTDLPEAEITITEPLFGDDNVINNAESKDSQEIGGTVGKSVRDGDVVKVTIGARPTRRRSPTVPGRSRFLLTRSVSWKQVKSQPRCLVRMSTVILTRPTMTRTSRCRPICQKLRSRLPSHCSVMTT
nr:Ig-like domain-containing protein [Alcaligenes faecalis]